VDRVDAVDQDVTDEVLGGDQREVPIEREDKQLVDPRMRDQLGFPIDAGEEAGLIPG
jgi:hypothetical protein